MVEAIKKPIFYYLHQEPLVPFSSRARLSKQPCVTNNENEQKILYTQTQGQKCINTCSPFQHTFKETENNKSQFLNEEITNGVSVLSSITQSITQGKDPKPVRCKEQTFCP